MTPEIHHKVLFRSKIAAMIDAVIADKAVCIVAPYGYGKTLAVVSWLRHSGRDAAYISLKETDNSESVFLSRLTDALLTFIGKAPPDSLKNLREQLYDVLSCGDKAENILIIDNFRFLQDPKLLIFIRDLIYDFLGHWHIILLSRRELSPVFNDLILKGCIGVIPFRALSFDLEETRQFFQMHGHTVPEDEMITIQTNVEGWPAGLNAVLTASRDGSICYNEIAHTYLMRFFETEIWGDLDASLRDFLLKTSVLDVLNPSSAYAVTGMNETRLILRELFLNGIFISKLNGTGQYRYHFAFREFLQDKLSASGIDQRALFLKVAWWLFEREEVSLSFPYFFKAMDLYGINRVLQILDPSRIGMERFVETFQCLTELSAAALKSYPVIVARMALIFYVTGNIARMQELCRLLTEWVVPGVLSITPEEYAEYVWEVGWLCYLNPGEEVYQNRTHEQWSNYREYLPHLNARHLARTGLLTYPSCLRGIRDYSHIIREVQGFLLHSEKAEYSTIREAHSIYQMHLMVAEYAYETEQIDKAEEAVMHIMPVVKERYVDLYFACVVLLVKILRAKHNKTEISALTHHLALAIHNHNAAHLLPNFHAFELVNRLNDGIAGFTEVFLKENEALEDKSYTFLIYRHFAFVRGLISIDSHHRALLILANLETLCQKCNNTMSLIEAGILKAIVLYRLGNRDAACMQMEAALTTSAPFGYIRLYSDESAALPILNLMKKQKGGSYLKKVIISCKKSLAVNAEQTKEIRGYSHIELTKTEKNILKSLQTGMSYQEIALDHHIQLSTVKSHVHSIYSKLDVGNKVSAILAAQEIGIL